MNNEVLSDFAQYQHSQKLAPKTVLNREHILRPLGRHIEAPLTNATTRDLRAYLARDGVKASTLRVERAAMIAFYTFLHEDGYRDDNPTKRLAPIKVPRSLPRPFTRDQIEAMLSSGVYKRTRVMILLGYYQGFRVSQIARVRGDDLQGDLIRTVAKGNKERWLPLHPEVKRIAQTMPDCWWFPSPYRAAPILATSVTDAITNAIKLAGITDPSLTPHSLRHSFGTELVEQGVDIRVIQELMLHDDISTTQIYARVSDTRRRAGLQLLPSVIAPQRSMRAAA